MNDAPEHFNFDADADLDALYVDPLYAPLTPADVEPVFIETVNVANWVKVTRILSTCEQTGIELGNLMVELPEDLKVGYFSANDAADIEAIADEIKECFPGGYGQAAEYGVAADLYGMWNPETNQRSTGIDIETLSADCVDDFDRAALQQFGEAIIENILKLAGEPTQGHVPLQEIELY